MHAPGSSDDDRAPRAPSHYKVFGRPLSESTWVDEDDEPAPVADQHDDPFATSEQGDAFPAEADDDFGPLEGFDELAEDPFDPFGGPPADANAPSIPRVEPAPRLAAPHTPRATEPAQPSTPRPGDRPAWYRDPAVWAHLAPLLSSVLLLSGVGLVPPLLIENTAGRRDDFVRDQAREALNFQLNVLLLNLVALVTLTAPLVWPLSIAFAIVLPIQAALDAKDGVRHRYPIVPRWLD